MRNILLVAVCMAAQLSFAQQAACVARKSPILGCQYEFVGALSGCILKCSPLKSTGPARPGVSLTGRGDDSSVSSARSSTGAASGGTNAVAGASQEARETATSALPGIAVSPSRVVRER